MLVKLRSRFAGGWRCLPDPKDNLVTNNLFGVARSSRAAAQRAESNLLII